MGQEEHEIDHHLKPPEPFDRAIANLDLRSVSNTTSEGLDLEVTASFGCDEIDIPLSDGGVLSVICGVKQALVVARPYIAISRIAVRSNMTVVFRCITSWHH